MDPTTNTHRGGESPLEPLTTKSRREGDRDLLFGLLAVQLEFITREAFLEALTHWKHNPTQPLDQILVENGWIARETHAVLDPLIEKHIKIHGDNPTMSIASMATAQDVRRELQELSATQMLSEADALTEALDASVADPPASPRPSTVGQPTAPGSRFRILRPHARGGLGFISVALDEELDRQVALKEIREEHLERPESRSRFLLEAEITGKLEHPGVIPVYGKGEYPDGRPYYAMRLVRGQSLEEEIDRFHRPTSMFNDGQEHGLWLRELLERFLDVCDAIAYAHSRGVIHRDLKPSNIMLGPFGETLVLDWGLAKPLGKPLGKALPDEDPLKTSSELYPNEEQGRPIGTPQFMSPEQAAGLPEQVGARSDIYGLGATLYMILTGRSPFEDADQGSIFHQVKHGLFPAPHVVHSGVPRTLEAICLKAMACRPEDRYPSVQALADDLKRWLADEPVSAYREPWSERLARWSRRHRAWALAILASLVVIGAVATIFGFWSRQVAARERQERIAAVEARQQAEEARAQVVRVAAQFAARTVAKEIDLHFQVLEAKAAAPECVRLVRAAIGQPWEHPSRQALQSWIVRQHEEAKHTIHAENWFLTDAKGTQLARGPYSRNSIDDNFCYRDYYHGLGYDLEPDEACKLLEEGRLGPIREPHQSIVFRGTATNTSRVTFTVPIWDGPEGEGEILGVLGISVGIGKFDMLRISESADLVAALVETEPDEHGRKGLVLQHPMLARPSVVRDLIVYLDPEKVEALEELRAQALKRAAREDDSLPLPGSLDRDYRDPFGGLYGGRWLAAFEPVLLLRESGRMVDTGWVVIVQGRHRALTRPGSNQ